MIVAEASINQLHGPSARCELVQFTPGKVTRERGDQVWMDMPKSIVGVNNQHPGPCRVQVVVRLVIISALYRPFFSHPLSTGNRADHGVRQ